MRRLSVRPQSPTEHFIATVENEFGEATIENVLVGRPNLVVGKNELLADSRIQVLDTYLVVTKRIHPLVGAPPEELSHR